MHVLIVETGKHKGKRLKLPEGETVVGRDPEAQVRIASNEVSRRHCLLIAEGERLRVRDLGSSNGTFVNGVPIQSDYELQPGDLLVIGPMGFRFPGPTSAEAVPPATAVPRKAAAGKEKDNLSDDEIALWLADGSSEQISSGDTAVLPVAEGAARPAAQEPIVPPKKKVFRTVAEEAADIIRRHKEALAAKNKEDRGK